MTRLTRIILALASGLMLSLPWLGFPGWILFFAWMPLLALDGFLHAEKSGFRSVVFPFYAFIAFITWNIMTTWWIVYATAVGAMLAILLNSLLMALVMWIVHLLRRNSAGAMGYVAWIVMWLAFEFFHFHWDIEWPWLTLGNGFANDIKMVQWYEFTGVLGGSLWILVVNMMLHMLLVRFFYGSGKGGILRYAIPVMLVVLIPVVLSLILYYNYSEDGEKRRILIVQPNIDPYSETFDEGAVNDKLVKFIRLAEKDIDEEVDYIIGPETVFEQDWDEARLLMYPAFNRLREIIAPFGKQSLIIGASTYRIYAPGDHVPATARKSRDGNYSYDRFNTAIFTDRYGEYQLYHKSILVSGVEKMPFRKYLRFLERFIIDLGGTTGSLGFQDYPENFEAVNGDRIAPVICYESVFGGYISQFVKKGAHFLVIITNDGWWRNTPGYKQHFAFARLRAVETRRSIARSANTGISGIINQRGEVIAKSDWWTEAVMKTELKINDKITFYVKYGDYIGRLSVFVSALLALYLVAVRMREKKIRTNPNCVKPR